VSTHLVDTGYVDALTLTASQRDYGVELLAICPEERRSVSWTPAKDGERDVIKIKFASADCGACASRKQCTHTTRPRRTLTIRPQQEYLALQSARVREAREEFANQYGVRAPASKAPRGSQETFPSSTRTPPLVAVLYMVPLN